MYASQIIFYIINMYINIIYKMTNLDLLELSISSVYYHAVTMIPQLHIHLVISKDFQMAWIQILQTLFKSEIPLI